MALKERYNSMYDDLTKKQIEIIEFIKSEIREKGYPPSVREIGTAVNLRSTSSVHNQLHNLERKGYIRRVTSKQRAIEVIGFNTFLEPEGKEEEDEEPMVVSDTVNVPILGSVAAGYPLMAEENVEDVYPMPYDVVGKDKCFMLHVNGDSMMDAGILDGDLVLCRQQIDASDGDIVVALIDDETTVKFFYRESGRIRLQPANDDYEPIYARELTIQGKVIAVMRLI